MEELISDIIELEGRAREILGSQQSATEEPSIDERTIKGLHDERIQADGSVEEMRRRMTESENELLAGMTEVFGNRMKRLEENFSKKFSSWEKEIYESVLNIDK